MKKLHLNTFLFLVFCGSSVLVSAQPYLLQPARVGVAKDDGQGGSSPSQTSAPHPGDTFDSEA